MFLIVSRYPELLLHFISPPGTSKGIGYKVQGYTIERGVYVSLKLGSTIRYTLPEAFSFVCFVDIPMPMDGRL